MFPATGGKLYDCVFDAAIAVQLCAYTTVPLVSVTTDVAVERRVWCGDHDQEHWNGADPRLAVDLDVGRQSKDHRVVELEILASRHQRHADQRDLEWDDRRGSDP